jgi:hypothetical protein
MVKNAERHYKKHILTGFFFPAIVCCYGIVLLEKAHWDVCALLIALSYVVRHLRYLLELVMFIIILFSWGYLK